MITLEKEKVTINPDIKVIKRDGRMVVFDSSKIQVFFTDVRKNGKT